MRKALTLLIALLCANLALAQNKPLACQVDAAAGLKWENGQWRIARFIEQKFILVLDGKILTKESVERAFNLGHSNFVCRTTFNGKILCNNDTGSQLFFNPYNLKGGLAATFGATMDDTPDTVSVDVFTCQTY